MSKDIFAINNTDKTLFKVDDEGGLYIKQDSDNNLLKLQDGLITGVTLDTLSNCFIITGINVGLSGQNALAIPKANADHVGGVKSTKTGTTENRDYNVEVNEDGTMKVNVPWVNYTYSVATYNSGGLMPKTMNIHLFIIDTITYYRKISTNINNARYLNSSGTITAFDTYSDVFYKNLYGYFASTNVSSYYFDMNIQFRCTINISATNVVVWLKPNKITFQGNILTFIFNDMQDILLGTPSYNSIPKADMVITLMRNDDSYQLSYIFYPKDDASSNVMLDDEQSILE